MLWYFLREIQFERTHHTKNSPSPTTTVSMQSFSIQYTVNLRRGKLVGSHHSNSDLRVLSGKLSHLRSSHNIHDTSILIVRLSLRKTSSLPMRLCIGIFSTEQD